MNNRRPLHVAILVAIACLFAFQSAGAVITSGYIEDFSEPQTSAEACTNIGYLMLSPGLGVGPAPATLLSVPPCYVMEGSEMTSAQASADSCSVGQSRSFLTTSGPGSQASLTDSMGAPLCDLPANLAQPVDAQDARQCDANAADLKHTEPCYKTD